MSLELLEFDLEGLTADDLERMIKDEGYFEGCQEDEIVEVIALEIYYLFDTDVNHKDLPSNLWEVLGTLGVIKEAVVEYINNMIRI